MANIAIKGHKTRGKEVIEILEMLGGNSAGYTGTFNNFYYWIEGGVITSSNSIPFNSIQFTLEEFEEKYPDKVGDRVCFPDDLSTPFTINKMWWDENANELLCSFIEDDIEVPVVGIRTYKEETLEVTEEFYNKHCVNCGSQRCTHNGEWLKECEHYKEETTNKAIFEGNAQSCYIMNNIIKENMKEIKIDIPKGYEFFGIDDDNKVVLTKKQFQYPKTYEECAKILNCFGAVNIDGYKGELLDKLQELLICRDAYWKIAGEQMGLSKPWESDFTNNDEERYGIYTLANKVEKDFCGVGDVNMILVFPTEEMRDAFYENFKELINDCKELL